MIQFYILIASFYCRIMMYNTSSNQPNIIRKTGRFLQIYKLNWKKVFNYVSFYTSKHNLPSSA